MIQSAERRQKASLEVEGMIQTPANQTSRRLRNDRQALVDLVRESCEVLLEAHPSVIGSMTISRRFEDATSARLSARMATRVAEEYGLDADTRLDSSEVVIRLSRDGDGIRLK
jgi:hypothetical protein